MIDLFSGDISPLFATGAALAALGAGIWYGRNSSRDTLAAAHRLSASTAAYYVRAERSRSLVLAAETPTQSMPLVELEAPSRTLTERLRHLAAEAVERVRPIRNPDDWAPGEMTLAFARIQADEPALAAAEHTMPVQPSPWVHPLAARGPVPPPPPPIVYAPRGLQDAPKRQTLPAPDAPSRARLRRAENPGLPGRMRAWGGSLLGPVPTLPEVKFPEPFRMPVPRPRLPHDPRRLAMLAADPTRQFRTRKAAA